MKRRPRLILKCKLNGKNKTTTINTWAVVLFRYGTGILQRKESKLKNVDRKSRQKMTMYGTLHPISDVDRLYIRRKEGGRSLMGVECSVREEKKIGFFMLPILEKTSLKDLCSRGNQY